MKNIMLFVAMIIALVITTNAAWAKKPYPFWIEVVGQNPLTLTKGQDFTDPGAIAHGPLKQDGPRKFVSVEKIDTTKSGPATLTYHWRNRLGKVIEVQRIVVVVEKSAPSPTATPKKEAKAKKFADRFLQIGWEQHVLDRVSESELPNGFSVNTWANVGQCFSIEVCPLKQVALKFAIDSTRTAEEMKVFGSSLGRIFVGPSWEGTLKFRPSLSDKVLPWIEGGVRFSHIEGNYSVGGFPFDRVGDGWSPLFGIGADVPITDWLAATAGYKVTKQDVVTAVPATVDLKTSLSGNVALGLVLRPF